MNVEKKTSPGKNQKSKQKEGKVRYIIRYSTHSVVGIILLLVQDFNENSKGKRSRI